MSNAGDEINPPPPNTYLEFTKRYPKLAEAWELIGISGKDGPLDSRVVRLLKLAIAIGAMGETVGEVVFNTSKTGYQEILTDPSYKGQIVTLTYPHIGNVGTNRDDEESEQIMASGLVIRDLPHLMSNWRAETPLEDYLKQQNIVAIADLTV